MQTNEWFSVYFLSNTMGISEPETTALLLKHNVTTQDGTLEQGLDALRQHAPIGYGAAMRRLRSYFNEAPGSFRNGKSAEQICAAWAVLVAEDKLILARSALTWGRGLGG